MIQKAQRNEGKVLVQSSYGKKLLKQVLKSCHQKRYAIRQTEDITKLKIVTLRSDPTYTAHQDQHLPLKFKFLRLNQGKSEEKQDLTEKASKQNKELKKPLPGRRGRPRKSATQAPEEGKAVKEDVGTNESLLTDSSIEITQDKSQVACDVSSNEILQKKVRNDQPRGRPRKDASKSDKNFAANAAKFNGRRRKLRASDSAQMEVEAEKQDTRENQIVSSLPKTNRNCKLSKPTMETACDLISDRALQPEAEHHSPVKASNDDNSSEASTKLTTVDEKTPRRGRPRKTLCHDVSKNEENIEEKNPTRSTKRRTITESLDATTEKQSCSREITRQEEDLTVAGQMDNVNKVVEFGQVERSPNILPREMDEESFTEAVEPTTVCSIASTNVIPQETEEKENSKKCIKLVIRSSGKGKVQVKEDSDPKYIVQSSRDNPLKIKLKTDRKKKKKDKKKDEIKLRLVLGTSTGKIESIPEHRHKKHKKKRHAEKSSEIVSHPLIIRIKSPRGSAIVMHSTATDFSLPRSGPSCHLSEASDQQVNSRHRRKSRSPREVEEGASPSQTMRYEIMSAAQGEREQQPDKRIANKEDVITQQQSDVFSVTRSRDSSSSFDRIRRGEAAKMKEMAPATSHPSLAFPISSSLTLPPGARPASSSPHVTFSPDSSPEHESGASFMDSALSKDEEGLCLPEGTFQDLMRVIDDSDGAPEGLSMAVASTAAAVARTSFVERSQVDGSADTCSRSSLVSLPPSPLTCLTEEEEEDEVVEEEEQEKLSNLVAHRKGRRIIPQNIIQERMKQTQTTRNMKPKNKLALIRIVFSTYTKNRKIVVVKYRKPKATIYSLQEFQERKTAGRLDEPYDEDLDDITMLKAKTPLKKQRTDVPEPQEGKPIFLKRPAAVFHRSQSSDDSMEEEEGSSGDETPSKRPKSTDDQPGLLDEVASEEADTKEAMSLECPVCSRAFPNAVRLHAHKQMHLDATKKQKRSSRTCPGGSVTVPTPSSRRLSTVDDSSNNEDDMDENISQLDGETDLNLPTTTASEKPLSAADPATNYRPLGTTSSSLIVTCTNANATRPTPVFSVLGTSASMHNPTRVIILSKGNTFSQANEGQVDLGRYAHSGLSQQHQGSLQQQTVAFLKSECKPIFSSMDMNNTFSTFAKELLTSDNAHPMLIKQDPVMMSNDKDDQDLILPDALNLFEEQVALDASNSAIHLSLDDIASFTQPMTTSGTDGSHASFDTSLETSSFLSGADALDIASETTNETASVSLPEIRSEAGTPSLSDDAEFPCPQCRKMFGNRRNLTSHIRRHTGDYKLFCGDCGKGFFTQSKMDSHKRKHTGEKPFRCLMKACLKRFRYKGDLAKHIKRYHPGHMQELVPIPLQQDEILTLQSNVSKQSSGFVAASTDKTSKEKGRVPQYFFPLLPQYPVKQSELAASGLNGTSSSFSHQQQYVVDDSDPSLDENILNMFTEDDNPTLSQSPPPVGTTSATSTSTPILHDVLTRGSASAFAHPAMKKETLSTVASFLVPTAIFKPCHIAQSPQSMQRVTATGIKFCLPSRPATSLQSNLVRPHATSLMAKSNSQSVTMTIDEMLACVQPLPISEASASGQKLPAEPASLAATSFLPSRPSKAFPCSHPGCHRSFEKATLLRRHQKLHSVNCKFVCDVCKKCFESQSKIDDHYRKHTGAKPFLCHLCGNSFRYKGDRTKHLKNLHGVSKSSSMSSSSRTITHLPVSEDSSTTSSLVVNFQEETSSSISSYHSMSDAGSTSRGNSILESQVKVECLPSVAFLEDKSQFSRSHHTASPLVQTIGNQETVTMSLDEVIQFAQPIVTDYY